MGAVLGLMNMAATQYARPGVSGSTVRIGGTLSGGTKYFSAKGEEKHVGEGAARTTVLAAQF